MLHPHEMNPLAKLDHAERIARSRSFWLLAANPPARGPRRTWILRGWSWLRMRLALRRDPARSA
jgi:hypothetical protein